MSIHEMPDNSDNSSNLEFIVPDYLSEEILGQAFSTEFNRLKMHFMRLGIENVENKLFSSYIDGNASYLFATDYETINHATGKRSFCRRLILNQEVNDVVGNESYMQIDDFFIDDKAEKLLHLPCTVKSGFVGNDERWMLTADSGPLLIYRAVKLGIHTGKDYTETVLPSMRLNDRSLTTIGKLLKHLPYFSSMDEPLKSVSGIGHPRN